MKEQNKHIKHNKKRKMIQVSMYHKDRKMMIEKYGKMLNAYEAKKVLLTNEIMIIHQNKDPEISRAVVELKRIGNNINQLAYVANANMKIQEEFILLQQFREIKQIIRAIRSLNEKTWEE